MKMKEADERRLQAHTERLERLAEKVSEVGFISSGSLVQRYMPCGKPGCRCQADPPVLHGPYWQWSRTEGGKTITRRLNSKQAKLYRQWIANRRRLTKLIAAMEEVSQRAAAILLAEAAPGERPRPAERHRI